MTQVSILREQLGAHGFGRERCSRRVEVKQWKAWVVGWGGTVVLPNHQFQCKALWPNEQTLGETALVRLQKAGNQHL